MARPEKHNLNDMNAGETREFSGLDDRELALIRRSAHNFNYRSKKYFVTRYRDGVLTVTRLK